MPLKSYDFDLPNVDLNGIAEDQTTAGAGNLVLNGALCDVGTAGQFDIGDTYPNGVGGVQIGIESSGNLAGVTFTVTGLDYNGDAQTEDITGPNNSTVESTTYWKRITQIAVDGAVGTNVEVGTVDEVMSVIIPVNYKAEEPATLIVTGLTGTIQFDVEETFQRTGITVPTVWDELLANQSADVNDTLTRHATACRVRVDSYTNTAEFQLAVNWGP